MSFGAYDPTKQANRFSRRKTFYLKDGSNLYRVLPPAKSLADKNKIAQYWSVLWLTDSRGKKRPVASIFRKNKDVILQYDPLLTRMEEMQKQLSAAIAANENPATVLALKENLKRIRNNKFYALNVLDASGALGVLEIPYTSYQNLDTRIRELQTNGMDAIGIGPDKGIFFDFKKLKDEKGRTVYPVDPAVRTGKDASGQFVMNYIRLALSEEEAGRIGEQVEDLTKLYRELTVEQQTALATMDQRVFDAVFARPVNQAVEEEQEAPAEEDTQTQLANYQAQQTQPVQQVVNVNSGYNPPATPTPNYGQGYSTGNPPVNAGNVVTSGVRTTIPQAPQQPMQPINSFQQGSVLNNDKVKNFLFPDGAKKA